MSRKMPHWSAWRLKTFQAYAAGGMPSDLAWRIAKAETAVRKRLARIIGMANARTALLQPINKAEGMTFALVLPLHMATDEQAAKLNLKAVFL